LRVGFLAQQAKQDHPKAPALEIIDNKQGWLSLGDIACYPGELAQP
jgi:hypothetical protein